jgi:hypothetical protein
MLLVNFANQIPKSLAIKVKITVIYIIPNIFVASSKRNEAPKKKKSTKGIHNVNEFIS